jgi:hypothetical protein
MSQATLRHRSTVMRAKQIGKSNPKRRVPNYTISSPRRIIKKQPAGVRLTDRTLDRNLKRNDLRQLES